MTLPIASSPLRAVRLEAQVVTGFEKRAWYGRLDPLRAFEAGYRAATWRGIHASSSVRTERLRMPAPGQEYFWTQEWLVGELEAADDIALGRVERFETASEALTYLFDTEE